MAFFSWRTWVTGETVTAAHMNQEIRDNLNAMFPDEDASVVWATSLEATVTDPAHAVLAAKEYRQGAMRHVFATFDLTNGGSGVYFVTLPSAPAGLQTSNIAFKGQVVGTWTFFNASEAGFSRSGPVQLAIGGTVRFAIDESALVSDALPIAKQNGDIISFFASYVYA